MGNLGIEPYKVCLTYAAKYPRFSKEMYDVDLSRTYQLTGKAKLEYGAVKNCKQAEGIISVNFKYQTTDESRDTLRRKWFYKDCMASKASPVWANRNSLPVTFSCLKTIKDAYTARRYVYDVTFDKMTDRMKNIITTAKSVIKAAALPTLGLDATDIDVTTVGGFLKLDATLKDDDRSADVTIETVSGVRKIKDYHSGWTGRKTSGTSFTRTPPPTYTRRESSRCARPLRRPLTPWTMRHTPTAHQAAGPSCLAIVQRAPPTPFSSRGTAAICLWP